MANQPSDPRTAGRRISGRAQLDSAIDPYEARSKPREPTLCHQCGVIFHNGRWQRGEPSADAGKGLCPSCRRINDGLPAGIVTLHGIFAAQQKNEMIALARHQEQAENNDHPLNRIMSVEKTATGILITTTDIHLPRRIGEAVKRAFHGNLDIHFDDRQYFVRVDWRPSC